ncbi:MAG TPA: hypothetical protein PKC18_16405, partial [Lacipirellulaceae bacterium]|nr:hypothetical protein [Lacipirellulaceae bacterium]
MSRTVAPFRIEFTNSATGPGSGYITVVEAGDAHHRVVAQPGLGRPKLVPQLGRELEDAEHARDPVLRLADQLRQVALRLDPRVVVHDRPQGLGHLDRADVLALHVADDRLLT